MKINFTYSSIYDWHFREVWKLRKKKGSYPSPEAVIKFTGQAGKYWRKYEKPVLAEIAQVAGLKWQAREIKVYIVGRAIPFSSPLTVRVYRSLNNFVDTLTHELIHQIFFQNEKKLRRVWPYFLKKYKLSGRALGHTPLYAIHEHIYRRLFSVVRLRKDQAAALTYNLPAYVRAWETVQKVGYKKLIKEFRARLVS